MNPNPDPIPGLRDGLVDAIAPYERRKVRRRAIAGTAAIAAIIGIGVAVWPSGDESTLDTANPDAVDDITDIDGTPPDTTPPEVVHDGPVDPDTGSGVTDPGESDTGGQLGDEVSSCTEAQLALSLGGSEGAAGTTYQQVVLTNIDIEPCHVPDDLQVEWSGTTPAGEFERISLPYEAATSAFNPVDGVLGRGDAAAIVFPYVASGIVTDDEGNSVPRGSTSSVGLRIDGGTGLGEIWIALEDLPAFNRAVGLVEPYPVEQNAIFAPADPTAGTALTPGQQISTVGLGAIRAGSTLQEVADATGLHVWAFEWAVASPGCGHAQVGGVQRSAVLLHILGDTDDLSDASVTAVVTTDPDVATPSGIRVGSPEADVLALGAERLSRIDSEYDDSYTWKFTPTDPAEQHLGVAFTIVDNSVSMIAGGQNNDVYRLEGCA